MPQWWPFHPSGPSAVRNEYVFDKLEFDDSAISKSTIMSMSQVASYLMKITLRVI